MAPKIPSGWSMTRKTVVVVVGERLLEPLMVVSWCVLCVVGPQRSSRSAALRWALAAGELDAGDAADDQAGEPSRRDEPRQGLGDEVQRRQQARGRRCQCGDRDRPRQLPGAKAGQSEGAEEDPEGWGVEYAPREELAAGQRGDAGLPPSPPTREGRRVPRRGGQGRGGEAPPAIAAVCSVRDPGPARPASRAT